VLAALGDAFLRELGLITVVFWPVAGTVHRWAEDGIVDCRGIDLAHGAQRGEALRIALAPLEVRR
jgi:hypothetical protein